MSSNPGETPSPYLALKHPQSKTAGFDVSDVARLYPDKISLSAESITQLRKYATGEALEEPKPFDREALTQMVTLSPTDQDGKKLRDDLWQHARALDSQLADPLMKEAHQVVTGIQDWVLFGGYEQPLPRGLVLGRSEDGFTTVDYDTRLPIPYAMLDQVQDFNTGVFNRAADARQKHLKDHEWSIKKETQKAVTESPAYRFLESFRSTETQERPLRAHEQFAVRAAMQDRVEIRYGMRPEDYILGMSDGVKVEKNQVHPFDEAMTEAKRIGPLVEQMTVWDKEQSDDPLIQARAYFTARLMHCSPPLDPQRKMHFKPESPVPAHLQAVFYQYGLPNVIERFSLNEVITMFGSQSLDGFDLYLNARVLTEAVSEMMSTWDENLPTSYDKVLKRAVDLPARDITSRLGYAADWAGPRFREPRPDSLYSQVLANVRSPKGEEVPFQVLSRAHNLHGAIAPAANTDKVSFLTWEQKEHALNTTVGDIVKRDNRLQHPNRDLQLITLAPVLRNRPPITGTEAVILSFDADKVDFESEVEPFLPGYRTVSKFECAFGFEPEVHDPYEGADRIAIDPAAVAKLRQRYARLGLRQLSDALGSDAQFTVKQLSDIIQHLGRYHYASESTSAQTRITFKTLDDAYQLIRNGELLFQCESAAQFTALSLKECGINAYVIGGSAIGAQDIHITQAGHAQVAVIHEGSLYITDPTPTQISSLDASDPDAAASQQLRPPQVSQASRRRRTASELAARAQSAARENHRPELTPAQSLAASRRRLEAYLHGVLREKNQDRLYQRIMKLGDSDPIRRTWEMAVQTTTWANAKPEELERTVVYLETLQKDIEVLRTMKLPAYSQGTLDMLTTLAKEIEASWKTITKTA